MVVVAVVFVVWTRLRPVIIERRQEEPMDDRPSH